MLCSLTVGLSPVKGCLPGPSPASQADVHTCWLELAGPAARSQAFLPRVPGHSMDMLSGQHPCLLGVRQGLEEERTWGRGKMIALWASFFRPLTQRILTAPTTSRPWGQCWRRGAKQETPALSSRTRRAASPTRTQAAFPSASRSPLVCRLCPSTCPPVHLSVHFCCAHHIWKQLISHSVWAPSAHSSRA